MGGNLVNFSRSACEPRSMRSLSLKHSECASDQNRHVQRMVEFEYFRLWGHITSRIDDLPPKCSKCWIASHATTDKYGVDPVGSKSFAEVV